MHKPFFHPPVPEFVLRTYLGKMSDIILKGSRVSSEKIIDSGYKFVHPSLDDALSATL
jgi:NAD dependent epimerase/dehydratase family enzyme